jgi:hypothetical protein
MRDASDGRRALQIMGKMQATPQDVTADEFDFLLLKSGVPTNQRSAALDAFDKLKKGQSPTGDDGVTDDGEDGTPKPLTLQQLPPEVQAAVARTRTLDAQEQQRQSTELRNQIEKDMKEVLTKDHTLSIIIANEASGQPIDWSKQDGWAASLFADAMDKVRSRVLLGREPNPELYAGVAQELRQRLLQVGKLARSEQAGPETALGPALGLPTKLQATEPVKRVPVTAPDASLNFKDRLMAMFNKAKASEK